jgi:hypothetical protein
METPGKLPGGSPPPGEIPGGSGSPFPGLPPDGGVGFGECVGGSCTATVTDDDAEEVACGDVPVAVRMMRVLGVCLGTAIFACNSTRWPAASPATVQEEFPAGWHTVKTGDMLFGLAERLIFALPLVPAVSHTQIAYLACVPGITDDPLSDCTDRHRWARGGGGVFVGVGEGDGDVLGVGLGDGVAVLLGEGWGDPLGPGEAVLLGLELAVAFGDPGATDGVGCCEVAAGLGVDDAEGFGVLAWTARAVRRIWDPFTRVAGRSTARVAVAAAAQDFVAGTLPGPEARNMPNTLDDTSDSPATRPIPCVLLCRVIMGDFSSTCSAIRVQSRRLNCPSAPRKHSPCMPSDTSRPRQATSAAQ